MADADSAALVVEEPDPVAYVAEAAPAVAEQQKVDSGVKCRSCESGNLSVQYGKYGYYFKCADCDGNTPIKVSCGKEDHKERIRKDGPKFFRECEQCKTSSLYFVNPT